LDGLVKAADLLVTTMTSAIALDEERSMSTHGLLRSALAGVCLQALTVLASTPAPAADISQSQPVSAAQARVWFLRPFDPALSFDPATIYANGAAIGESRPGTAFSVDLAPGTYTFTVPNDLSDGQQAPTVQLTSGAQVYFNVDADDWVDAGEQEQDHSRDTLDLRQISAPLAAAYLPALTELPHG
jgi:hypothetical protein